MCFSFHLIYLYIVLRSTNTLVVQTGGKNQCLVHSSSHMNDMCVLRHSIPNEFVPPCLQIHRVSNLKERFNGGKDCIPGLYKTSEKIVCWWLVFWFPGRVWLDEFCCLASTNLQHNLLIFCLRDVGKNKPTAKKRQEGKRLSHANTSNSAAYTGKTQPRLHNQVSHARRTN